MSFEMNRALQWKLIAGFLLVFVAGGITGAFVGGSYARHHFFELRHPERIGGANERKAPRRLNLTPEQLAEHFANHRQHNCSTARYSRDTGRRVRPDHCGRTSPDGYPTSLTNSVKS
jgi:hypothetical protein